MRKLLRALRGCVFELVAGAGLLWAKLTGVHVCADEVLAVFGILGGVRYVPGWVRAAWARRHQKPTCHHEHGHDEPAEPKYVIDVPPQYVATEIDVHTEHCCITHGCKYAYYGDDESECTVVSGKLAQSIKCGNAYTCPDWEREMFEQGYKEPK